MQEFDVLVLGGGASGLRAAVAARRGGAAVALVTKIHPLRSNTGVAFGGLNAPLGSDDSAAEFAEDTIIAGDGLNDGAVVRAFCEQARSDVLWLERMGVPFNRDSGGKLDRRPFGANRHHRTCYTDDWIGHIVLQVAYEQFQRSRAALFDDCFVTSLMIDNGNCVGATALNLRTGALGMLSSAGAVILATGGFLPALSSFDSFDRNDRRRSEPGLSRGRAPDGHRDGTIPSDRVSRRRWIINH